MDGFVDRLQALRFLHACDPSYRALTFTLVGLPPTGYISLLLDILFGSFLPSLWSSSNQSLLGSRSRHCYAIKKLCFRGFKFSEQDPMIDVTVAYGIPRSKGQPYR